MTFQNYLPVKQVSIIQVDGIDDVNRHQVYNGQNQMFINKDETVIFVKSGMPNGSIVDTYVKQPAPKPPEYVTMDQLQQILSQFVVKEKPTDEPV